MPPVLRLRRMSAWMLSRGRALILRPAVQTSPAAARRMRDGLNYHSTTKALSAATNCIRWRLAVRTGREERFIRSAFHDPPSRAKISRETSTVPPDHGAPSS